MTDAEKWEYGFYDSEHPDQGPYWYVFGILKHETASSALHTGQKSVWGQTVLVKRHAGEKDPKVWEKLTEAEIEGAWDVYFGRTTSDSGAS